MDSSTTLIFIIAAFSSALLLIMKRDALPPAYRRSLALIALVLIAFAFFLIVYSLFTLGTD